MRVAGSAGEALPAGEVAFQGDPVAPFQAGHSGADLDDGAGALVAGDDGQVEVECLRGGCPFVDLPVGAAQRRGGHLDDHLGVGGLGVRVVGHVLEAEFGGVLDYSSHGCFRSSLKDRRGWLLRWVSAA